MYHCNDMIRKLMSGEAQWLIIERCELLWTLKYLGFSTRIKILCTPDIVRSFKECLVLIFFACTKCVCLKIVMTHFK